MVMGYSIHTEKYRYTEWDEGREGLELYDHDKDPDEFHNLAQDPSMKDVVARLKKMLEEQKAKHPQMEKREVRGNISDPQG